MALLLASTSTGTGANITTSIELAQFTSPTGGCLVKPSIRLSNMNTGGSATVTVAWKEYQSDGVTLVRGRTEAGYAKFAASDSVWGQDYPVLGAGMSGLYIPEGNKLGISVSSNNANDTNVTWSIAWVNMAHGDVGAISGDSTAADNLEAMLDGTGGVGLTLNALTIAASGASTALTITSATGLAMQVQGGTGVQLVGTTGTALDIGGTTEGMLVSASSGKAILLSGSASDLYFSGTGTATNASGTMLSHAVVAGVTASTLSTLSGSAAADAIWDEALSGHTGTGSAGKALGYVTGTPATAAATADAVWDEAIADHATAGTTGARLASIYTYTAAIGSASGNLVVLSPVLNGSLEVVRGDCYRYADGRQLTFTKASGANWPTTISGWSIKLTAHTHADNTNSGTGTFTCTGTVSVATGDSQAVYFDTLIPTTLALGLYNFDVEATGPTTGGAEKATLVIGLMRVLEDES